MTYLVHSLVQESPAQTVGPVLDPETSGEVHSNAGLGTLAESADRRARANAQFEPLDQHADNWRRTLEYTYSLAQFNDERLPAPVVAELARVRTEKLFDRTEVWSRYPHKSRNEEVVFVGIIGEYPKPTTYYVVAQWSPNDQDTLTTNDMLRRRARAQGNPLIAYSIMPSKAQIALAICGALFALAAISTNWELALACMFASVIGWVSGKPLADGDDDLAGYVYVGMGCLGIASAVLTVVLGAAT